MPRISIASIRQLVSGAPGLGRSPRLIARLVLASLLALNLFAALLVFKPWASSADSLEGRAASLRQEVKQTQSSADRLRSLVSKVSTARTDGDTFMASNLLDRRTVSSSLLNELDQMARTAGIKQKEVSFGFEPIEGSESLTRAEITASYEGSYANLTHFLNLLDHSPRLLIVDSLAATPQPTGDALEVTIKLNAFVREGAAQDPAPEQASAQPPRRAQ